MVDGLDASTSQREVGTYPSAIAVDSSQNRIYTVNQGDNSASIIAGAE